LTQTINILRNTRSNVILFIVILPKSYQGLKLEQYLQMMGKTQEDLKKEYEPQAIEGIKSRLALEAVIKAEKIEATDSELEEKMKEMAKNYGKENDEEFLKNEKVRNAVSKLMSKNTVAMDNYPLSSIYELLLLSKGVQKNIKKIFAPALIVHSLEDDLTSTKSAKFVFNNISSFYKEYMELKDSYHLVLYDNEKEKVYNKTMEFIDALSYKRNINLKELRDRKK